MTRRLPFRQLQYQGVGKGATPFPGLLHFTLDPYLIMLSVKQGGIKYHFLSLWYDSTWDWTQVTRAISEYSNHHADVRLVGLESSKSDICKTKNVLQKRTELSSFFSLIIGWFLSCTISNGSAFPYSFAYSCNSFFIIHTISSHLVLCMIIFYGPSLWVPIFKNAPEYITRKTIHLFLWFDFFWTVWL